MHATALALFLVLAGPPTDTSRVVPPADSVQTPGSTNAELAAIPTQDALTAGATSRLAAMGPMVEDTVPRRRRSIEVSEWYERRLRIHRYGAYTVIPLFAFQAIAGNQVFEKGDGAPRWAKTGHRAGASALAGVFTLNTVTGLWNLWDSREAEQGRGRRTVHTLLMLASDAGFTYAGVRLSEQAENDAGKRRQHRNLAYASMATALTGAGVMVFGRD
jgi:hypothetical protein